MQVAIYLFACLLQVPNAVLILLMVFSAGSPVLDGAWSCTADAAADPACAAVVANPTTEGFCALSPSQWAWTHPNHKVISKFNLVCADAWKCQLANSFFFVGYLIGSGLCGVIADAYGRKGVTFGATCLGAVFTAAALGATNYWVLLALRLLTGAYNVHGAEAAGAHCDRKNPLYVCLSVWGHQFVGASVCGFHIQCVYLFECVRLCACMRVRMCYLACPHLSVSCMCICACACMHTSIQW